MKRNWRRASSLPIVFWKESLLQICNQKACKNFKQHAIYHHWNNTGSACCSASDNLGPGTRSYKPNFNYLSKIPETNTTTKHPSSGSIKRKLALKMPRHVPQNCLIAYFPLNLCTNPRCQWHCKKASMKNSPPKLMKP